MAATAPAFNAAAPPFARKLARAMKVFDKDHSRLDGFIRCRDEMQQRRMDFARGILQKTDITAFSSLAEIMSIMSSVQEAAAGLGTNPHAVESNEQLQQGFRDSIGRLKDYVTRLRAEQAIDPLEDSRNAFGPLAEDQKAFCAAGRRVLTATGIDTATANDISQSLKDIEDVQRGYEQMFEARAQHEKDLGRIIRSAGIFIERLAEVCGVSKQYVCDLKEAIASCTEGAAAPVTVHKALKLRKPGT